MAVIRRENENIQAIQSDIKGILISILQLMVVHKEHLTIDIIQGDRTTIFEVDLHPSDFGRVLGVKGRNIGGLRAITVAISSTHGFRSVIRIKDESRFF